MNKSINTKPSDLLRALEDMQVKTETLRRWILEYHNLLVAVIKMHSLPESQKWDCRGDVLPAYYEAEQKVYEAAGIKEEGL